MVDEEVPESKSVTWLKSDRLTKNTITEYREDSFLGYVKLDLTAKEVFSNLDSIYERKSIASQLALRKKL